MSTINWWHKWTFECLSYYYIIVKPVCVSVCLSFTKIWAKILADQDCTTTTTTDTTTTTATTTYSCSSGSSSYSNSCSSGGCSSSSSSCSSCNHCFLTVRCFSFFGLTIYLIFRFLLKKILFHFWTFKSIFFLLFVKPFFGLL